MLSSPVAQAILALPCPQFHRLQLPGPATVLPWLLPISDRTCPGQLGIGAVSAVLQAADTVEKNESDAQGGAGNKQPPHAVNIRGGDLLKELITGFRRFSRFTHRFQGQSGTACVRHPPQSGVEPLSCQPRQLLTPLYLTCPAPEVDV